MVNQCTILNNSSVLTNILAKLTYESLDTVNFSTDDIFNMTNNLDTNEAHDHDMLSIRMMKLCRNSIWKPLSIIFNDFLMEGKFLVPKETNRVWKIIDLFPYFQSALKFFSVTFITSFLPFFIDNNFISSNQSVFRPADYCINQLIAITRELYKSFDDRLEVRGVFFRYIKGFW